MEDVLRFIKEYKEIYKIERYVSISVSIITLIILLCFFGYQIFINRDKDVESWTTVANAFIGLGSTGIITIAIGYIYKFMDKAMEAAEKFVTNRNNNPNGK